jgi:hypothetical protein
MRKTTGYLLISLHTLIVLFFIFHERLWFPPWLQSFGRVHPLFLHLPIGALVITIGVAFFHRFSLAEGILEFLLAFTALSAAATALMGIVLGAEDGYAPDALDAHRWAGVITSLLAWGTYVSYTLPAKAIVFRGMLIANFISLLVAGHLGGVITHGDRFILAPLIQTAQDDLPLSDSTSLFRAAVFPVLEQKCMSCHNDAKKKGGLSFASGAAMMTGGEHGTPWHAGEARKSLLISRILLPEVHKEHMPPDGRPQLNLTEVSLLMNWIQSGADTALAWTAYSKQDTVRKLAESLMARHENNQARDYPFDAAADETVAQLNDAYRNVGPVALNVPALTASFYIRDQYQPARLRDLLAVREQLVELNAAGMPLTDDDCRVISEFTNLERLNINFSSVTSECLQSLSALKQLRSLSVAGTALNDDALVQLKDFAALEEVFIWNTNVKSPDQLSILLAGIRVQTGAVLDEKEILRLSAPQLVNESMILDTEDSVRLSHKLPGTIIRYTVDGSEPDTTSSPVLAGPLAIAGCTEVKAVACKPGWYCSKAARFMFFRQGPAPATTALNKPPDKDYRGQGAVTISDNKKGFADNTRGDIAWLGYRENPFDATLSFDAPPEVNEIVISYARNIPAFLFPPASAEVWAGDDKKDLKMIRAITPPPPLEAGRTAIEALRIPLDQARFRHYRIIVRPVPQLPKWHPANKKETKDKRGWVFIDEVFFN